MSGIQNNFIKTPIAKKSVQQHGIVRINVFEVKEWTRKNKLY